MAFKEAVEQLSTVVRWKPEPKDAEDKSVFMGTILTGYYIGMKTGIGQNDSNMYDIELTEGPATGQVIAIWGSGVLDGKFSEIPAGCMVRVTYLGIAQPKSPKGRAYMNFKVEFDETSRRPMRTAGPADVSGQAPAAAPVAPAQEAPIAVPGW
jgi:hypothetical protein